MSQLQLIKGYRLLILSNSGVTEHEHLYVVNPTQPSTDTADFIGPEFQEV